MTISNNEKTITMNADDRYARSVFKDSIPLKGIHTLTLKYTQGEWMHMGVVSSREIFKGSGYIGKNINEWGYTFGEKGNNDKWVKYGNAINTIGSTV